MLKKVRKAAKKRWICAQCGEPYYESQEVSLMLKALTALEKEADGLLKNSA